MRMTQRLVLLVVLVLGLTVSRASHADAVDTLIKQLQSDSASKNVRLAAAVNLAKQSDQRIILPMVKVLGSDEDAQVRAVAAAALGKLITADTKPVLKDLTVKTLTKAAADDDSDDVKSQAAASLKLITGKSTSVGPSKTTPSGGAGGSSGGIYVNVGPMSAKDPKLRALMVKTAGKTLTSSEPAWLQTWAGGGLPNRPALDAKKMAGFYVDGTLNEVTDTPSGSNATVACKVSMLLATFPEKSAFGFLSGGAKVQASNTASDIALAHQDCVEAVITDLIAHKIVPTIKTKAP